MEGVVTFASLIVGVAVTDQLMSLHRLLKERSRVRWDALALLIAFLITLTIIMVWWSVAKPTNEPMSIGGFLPIFFVLVCQFLLAAISLPDAGDEAEWDLRAHYDRNAPYLWTLYVVSSLAANLHSIWGMRQDGVGWERIAGIYAIDFGVITFLMGSLIFVKKRWWHWTVVALLMIGPINWLGRTLG